MYMHAHFIVMGLLDQVFSTKSMTIPPTLVKMPEIRKPFVKSLMSGRARAGRAREETRRQQRYWACTHALNMMCDSSELVLCIVVHDHAVYLGALWVFEHVKKQGILDQQTSDNMMTGRAREERAREEMAREEMAREEMARQQR